jgi:hypothetical protein
MPEDVLDRLRHAAGPDLAPSEAAHRHGLTALQAAIDRELAPPRRRRVRPQMAVAIGGLCALALGVVALMPGRGPEAREVLERAAAAVALDDGAIVYARTESHTRSIDGSIQRFGTREIWVRRVPGATSPHMRSLYTSGLLAGVEDVTRPDPNPAAGALPSITEEYSPKDDRITVHRGAAQVPGEIFQARDLLRRSSAGDAEIALTDDAVLNGRRALKLEWEEPSPPGHHVEMTLWIDPGTYAPLRFMDHGRGTDADGKPYDQTFVATVTAFERLPDTPANRRFLEMGEHPGAERHAAGG